MSDIKIIIDGEELDYDASNPDFPVSFDYQLEDVHNFQDKKSSESIGLKLPATLNNQKILNTFQNTAYLDTTENGFFKGIRDFIAVVNGMEIFKGKAFPKRAKKIGGRPTSYEINVFGNNADWIISLKDVTLFDIMKHISFQHTKMNIMNSWQFDGMNEDMPYVFAPVKYANWLDEKMQFDRNYALETMKPSLSVYWMIIWAFKSAGYRVESEFLNSHWGRRLVMPWTFGAFLSSEGTKYQIHYFLAKTPVPKLFEEYDGFIDLEVRDDVDGAFDNNNTIPNPPGDYEYLEEAKEMKWTYNTPHYGPLEATFQMALFYEYNLGSAGFIVIRAHFYKNGIPQEVVEVLVDSQSIGTKYGADLKYVWFSTTVNPEDTVSAKVYYYCLNGGASISVDEYKLAYFRIPIGGIISFDSYLKLQKEKFLEMLRGLTDLFNLNFQTDPIKKIVLIEPAHAYSLDNDLTKTRGGYFNSNIIEWSEKEDISKESDVEIYDNNDRQFTFKFKDDNNDGALKVVQDRYKIILGAAKYIFDERFKASKKEYNNRYFSPTMHYMVTDFQNITGEPPQMICMVPENISNTSSSESENTFNPKIAYYKGFIAGVGGWVFDGSHLIAYPFMFAVNYKPGGENDPILSYSDEKIGDEPNYVVGHGLLKRFFMQRLVIMNNGQWLTSNFLLNNNDIVNWFHRERINLNGELFELINIKNYSPLKNESTKCTMRKWVPVKKNDLKNIYPSSQSVLTEAIEIYGEETETGNSNEIDKVFDTQYNRLMCLYNDIPRPEKNEENGG